MKKFRKVLSFIFVGLFLLPIIGDAILIGWGFRTNLLPANYLILVFGLSVGLLIHPQISTVTKRLSFTTAGITPLVFLLGCGYEYYKAAVLPATIKEANGLSYFYFDEEGYWIEEKDELADFSEILSTGELKVAWGDTKWFWIYGGNSCSCGRGEPLAFKGSREKVTFKHGNFQRLGFLSIQNSNQREFVSRLHEKIDEWQDDTSHNQSLVVTPFAGAPGAPQL